MCLRISKHFFDGAKRIRQIPGKVHAWKVMRHSYSVPVGCSLLYSKFYDHVWDIGWNCSTRRNVLPQKFENQELKIYGNCDIGEGIHVYLRKQDAVDRCTSAFDIVVRVECHNKHLVARNTRDLYHKTSQAVYTKVFLARDEYDKALKREAIERE